MARGIACGTTKLCGISFMENGAMKKIKQGSMRASLLCLFWRQIVGAIALSVDLLLPLKQLIN